MAFLPFVYWLSARLLYGVEVTYYQSAIYKMHTNKNGGSERVSSQADGRPTVCSLDCSNRQLCENLRITAILNLYSQIVKHEVYPT